MKINNATTASYAYDAGTAFGGRIGNMTSKNEGGTVAMAYSLEHMHAPNSVGYDKNLWRAPHRYGNANPWGL